MCIQHTVILTSLCKWKRYKWLFFVVKRYAVREAKKWRYAVRNAKIKRYAVRKGEGGVTLSLDMCIRLKHDLIGGTSASGGKGAPLRLESI